MTAQLEKLFYYSEDVAAALDTTRQSVRNWVKDGTLPAPICIGRIIRWPASVIEPVLRRLRGETEGGAA